MENESITETVVEEIATGGKRKNSRGDKSAVILCPKCLANGIRKECRGRIGLETHDDWEHNPKKKAKRMAAAARVGRERMLRNRGMKVPVIGRPRKKQVSTSMTRAYKNNWYRKNKAKVANARKRRMGHEVEMEIPSSANGVQPLQRAANPRLLQFWRELEAVEQALAYVQNQ